MTSRSAGVGRNNTGPVSSLFVNEFSHAPWRSAAVISKAIRSAFRAALSLHQFHTMSNAAALPNMGKINGVLRALFMMSRLIGRKSWHFNSTS